MDVVAPCEPKVVKFQPPNLCHQKRAPGLGWVVLGDDI